MGGRVVAGAVGGAVGAAVVGGGVALSVGGALVGATVARTVGGAEEIDGSALWLEVALGEGDEDAGRKRAPAPKNTTPMRRIVSRLPATAASSTSTHLGPRRGGGMIFVVSPAGVVMNTSAARAVPLEGRTGARSAPCFARSRRPVARAGTG